jgi:hypothetical protein
MRIGLSAVLAVCFMAGCGGGGGGGGIPAGIDLIVSSVTPPTNTPWGGVISVDSVLRNRGKTDSANTWNVEIRFSADKTIDDTDTLLYSYTVTGLTAQTDLPDTHVATIPASGADGIYYIGYIVDTTDVEAEAVESNNTGCGIIYVGSATEPDFVASNAIAPNIMLTGRNAIVSINVKNNAVPYAGDVTVSAYLSTTATINPATATLIGTAAVSNVPVDSTLKVNVSSLLPGNAPTGNVYIGAYIDPADTIPEGNESNNEAHKSIYIEKAYPGDDQYEPDDIYEHANTLSINAGGQVHNFRSMDDEDWLVFTLTVDLYNTITLYNVSPALPNGNPQMDIYDSSFTDLGSTDMVHGGLLTSSGPIPAGTYYICVHQGTGGVVPTTYSIRVTSP